MTLLFVNKHKLRIKIIFEITLQQNNLSLLKFVKKNEQRLKIKILIVDKHVIDEYNQK